MKTFLFYASLFLGSALFGQDNGTLSGQVRDTTNEEPLAFASVVLKTQEETVVGVDFKHQKAFVDRTASSPGMNHEKFPGIDGVPFEPGIAEVRLDIFADHSVVEVFIQEGQFVITNMVFPSAESDAIELFAEGGEAEFVDLEIHTIKSTWR